MKGMIAKKNDTTLQFDESNLDSFDMDVSHYNGMQERSKWIFQKENFKKNTKDDDVEDQFHQKSHFSLDKYSSKQNNIQQNDKNKDEDDDKQESQQSVILREPRLNKKGKREVSLIIHHSFSSVEQRNKISDKMQKFQTFAGQKQSSDESSSEIEELDEQEEQEQPVQPVDKTFLQKQTRRLGLLQPQKEFIQNNIFSQLGIQKAISIGKGLVLLFNINKFKKKIKNVGGMKFKNLSKNTFQLINDASMNYDYYYYSKRFTRVTYFSQIIKKFKDIYH